jgi:hypothetical protein
VQHLFFFSCTIFPVWYFSFFFGVINGVSVLILCTYQLFLSTFRVYSFSLLVYSHFKDVNPIILSIVGCKPLFYALSLSLSCHLFENSAFSHFFFCFFFYYPYDELTFFCLNCRIWKQMTPKFCFIRKHHQNVSTNQQSERNKSILATLPVFFLFFFLLLLWWTYVFRLNCRIWKQMTPKFCFIRKHHQNVSTNQQSERNESILATLPVFFCLIADI